MSQLKVSELFETSNKKNLMRLEIYDDVLVKCHKRIKYNSTLERTYCFYQIPEFIIGVPLYKVEEMRIYIINCLKKDGLQVMYIDPNWIFISWANPSMKNIVVFYQFSINVPQQLVEDYVKKDYCMYLLDFS